MKHNYFLSVCVAITLASCSNDSVYEALQSTDESVITETKAIELASTAYSTFFTNNTRSQNTINVRKDAVYSYCGKNTRGQESTPLYYVVNFEDDLGFALVSAHTIENSILGISDKGFYNPNEDCKNENFQIFIESLPDYIEQQSTTISLPSTPDYPLNPGVSGIVIPKIKVQWGLKEVYGDSCANHISGCTATAGAMVMSYYRQPTSMPLTIHEQNGTLTLDWTEINKHTRNNTGCNETHADITHPQISQLFAQIGKHINADYKNPNVTLAYRNRLLDLLRNYNYTCTAFQNFSSMNYRDYLDNDYIMLIRGSGNNSNEAGHIWIMDGYKRIVTSMSLTTGQINEITYCHYNWGWDGNSNGYFLSDVFDCTQAERYDNADWGVDSHDFNKYVMLSAVKYTATH